MSTCCDRSGARAGAIASAIAFLVISLLASVGPAAAKPQWLTVVEFYTAQGCKACRTAEELLGELSGEDGILALGFHVDYWDYIGWADPFASAAFTQRQRNYLERMGLPYVFTPQVVVDGTLHTSGNEAQQVRAGIVQAPAEERGRVPLTLSRISDGEVHLRIPQSEVVYRGEADVVMVRFEGKLSTRVTRGENHGQTLVNHNVVRLVRPVAVWTGAAIDMVVPLQDIAEVGPAFCAVFVQERGQGRILGAAVVDMRRP
jgi:hypothetical protein